MAASHPLRNGPQIHRVLDVVTIRGHSDRVHGCPEKRRHGFPPQCPQDRQVSDAHVYARGRMLLLCYELFDPAIHLSDHPSHYYLAVLVLIWVELGPSLI